MTPDSMTSTAQQGSSRRLSAPSTRLVAELPDREVREVVYGREMSRTVEPGASLTAISGASPTSSPTLASDRQVAPSVQDALSTSFIDARTVGIETWPIHGLLTWEGKVVEVGKEIFTAELTSLDEQSKTSVLRADFRIDALDLGDHAAAVGDLFYMTARKVRIRGRLSTSYSLQIRRPGNWTDADVADIRSRTRARLQLLEDNVE